MLSSELAPPADEPDRQHGQRGCWCRVAHHDAKGDVDQRGGRRHDEHPAAMDVALMRTDLSALVRLTVSNTNRASACPIQPTDVITCSHTAASRQRLDARVAMRRGCRRGAAGTSNDIRR